MNIWFYIRYVNFKTNIVTALPMIISLFYAFLLLKNKNIFVMKRDYFQSEHFSASAFRLS